MANITTDENYPSVVLEILDSHVPPRPAKVDGIPVWETSDPTVLTVTTSLDGMSALVDTVAPGTARITVTADADLGEGISTITGVTEDVIVTLGPASAATTMALNLGEPVAKV